jgi:hypothetical protein
MSDTITPLVLAGLWYGRRAGETQLKESVEFDRRFDGLVLPEPPLFGEETISEGRQVENLGVRVGAANLLREVGAEHDWHVDVDHDQRRMDGRASRSAARRPDHSPRCAERSGRGERSVHKHANGFFIIDDEHGRATHASGIGLSR